MMRKHTTVTAAAPGVGKSTLTIEEAVSLASGRDFLGFGISRPHKVAVINNVEFDHADIYADLEAVKLAFRRFMNLVPENGRLIVAIDEPLKRIVADQRKLVGRIVGRHGGLCILRRPGELCAQKQ